MLLRRLHPLLLKTALLLLCLLHEVAFAHTALVSSQPADGAQVAAPSVLVLEFSGPVSLLKLAVTSQAGAVDVGFKPRAEAAARHEVVLPALSAGHYEVDWTIVGADGHSISKRFSFTVAAAGGEAALHGAE